MNHTFNSLAAKVLVSTALAASTLVIAAPFTWGQYADDIRLINQGPGWGTLPLAISRDGMPFEVRNQTDPLVAQFAGWATWPGAQILQGDFNNDGRRDVALINRNPQSGWQTMPVAYANADGTFRIENRFIGQFAWAMQATGAEVVTGDFNGDGRTDVALINRTPGWAAAILLLTQADGSFAVAKWNLGPFAGWATEFGAEWDGIALKAGDFNNDKLTDIALVRPCGPWTTIPVAYAQPQGGFRIENHPASAFAQSCAYLESVVAGDFNGDGKTDLAAFTPGSMIVATATGSGFSVSTPLIGNSFSQRFSGGVTILTGKFDAGSTTDIALVDRYRNWGSVEIAFGNAGSNGQFTLRELQVPDFAFWATKGATPVVGDFDGNGQSDIALVPRAGTQSEGWATIPIAYSYMKDIPSVSPPCFLNPKLVCPPTVPAYSVPIFNVQNQFAPGFADWAKSSTVKIVTGEFGR